jgi:hypothetical protein
MGATGFAIANRKTRVGNMPYLDTDEPTGFEHLMPGAATSESTQTDPGVAPGAAPSVERVAATSRATGGAEAPAAQATAAEPRKRRRGVTLASLGSNVDKPSILGN